MIASAVSGGFPGSPPCACSVGKLCAYETDATIRNPRTLRIRMDTPLLLTLRSSLWESSVATALGCKASATDRPPRVRSVVVRVHAVSGTGEEIDVAFQPT